MLHYMSHDIEFVVTLNVIIMKYSSIFYVNIILMGCLGKKIPKVINLLAKFTKFDAT